MKRGALAVVFGAVGVLAVAIVLLQTGLWVDVVGVGEYDEGTVTVYENGNAAATETAASETATPTDSPTATDAPATTVAVRGNESQPLAAVEVRISDTFEQRYTGLSDTESLGPDEGMLFVHDEEGQYAYVMRDMDFPLDIIFIDANGTITTIHHAPLPPEGTSESELARYEGRGKYVLEVNRGWANRTGVSVGDTVTLPAGVE
ncbi:DUF192 domain-containing protein [Haloarcula marina]|uniref:DUF192 domain-containing protein n=1 Tax=Haloarcula marina TaxID=2961574 RepID=UPI0020B8ED35|nr:DUF192 domain-containing protein [Halomicroarcula marina]